MKKSTFKENKKIWRFILIAFLMPIVLLAILLPGCADEEEAETEPLPDISGVWRGYLQETASENFGETILTLDQRGGNLQGTWTAKFSSGITNGGTLSGTVSPDADSAAIILESAQPELGFCPLSVTVAFGPENANGNYNTIDCPYGYSSGIIAVYPDTPEGPGYHPLVPEQPKGVFAEVGVESITITWANVAQASGYNLYWSIRSGLAPDTGQKIARVPNGFVHADLIAGDTYYYIITATNLGGESMASTEVQATPVQP